MTSAEYRWPAEWERQSALLVAWPFAGGDWHDVLEAIQTEYETLVRTVLDFQRVVLLAQPGHADELAARFGRPGDLHVLEIPYNDTWCRDYGPVTLVAAGRRLALDFHFDGWGGRHEARLDNRVNTWLSRDPLFEDLAFRQSLFELEGGAIESDGRGTLLINRHCLRARHPHLEDREVDFELKHWLNVDHVLEIDMPPIPGDDTDGHIDTLARFVGPDRIAFQALRDDNDTRKLLGQLELLRNADGESFALQQLPCPADVDPSLAASYANFVLVNDAVLVPAYGSREDDRARGRLEDLFPDRRIVAVPASTLVGQGGGPHCATMQIPDALA
ncbi:MAG: agmatine deiminase family protein [Wenzhouxiangellaceae bacterium]|nr:agmatine deiminase family protein [Wenzhouxiangellaceae bacterium]